MNVVHKFLIKPFILELIAFLSCVFLIMIASYSYTDYLPIAGGLIVGFLINVIKKKYVFAGKMHG